MFYTEEEVSVITGLLNAYLVREHASEKVRECKRASISIRPSSRSLHQYGRRNNSAFSSQT